MNYFRQQIKTEQERIQRLIDLMVIPQNAAQAGRLTSERRGAKTYFYEQWYDHGRRTGKRYLGTPDSEAVCRHVQMRLQQERLQRLEKNQKLLARVEEGYQDYDSESILMGLPPAYQKAASRDQDLFDARYEAVRRWANGNYRRNTAPFPEAATYAKDGTHVRSKGECIYYNIAQEHGLLFVYDSYMKFTNLHGETREFCPDFVFRCLDGRTIIVEHLGRLHDVKYALDFGEKCHWYVQCGFVLGKNFFVTSDDAKGGTDSRAILEVLEKVERMFFGY
ncbi:MAG: hypothetical protein IJ109_06475 [Firmicutes bacterium]|nr:hypothetical protein [Bacillota bacterium]